MMGDLMDDGENRALRMFLAYYGGSCGIQVGNMKVNLRMAGFDGAWPAWCNEPGEDGQHLTKGGAQLWIRHLLSLEPAPQPAKGCELPDEWPAEFCTWYQNLPDFKPEQLWPIWNARPLHSAQPVAPQPAQGEPLSLAREVLKLNALWNKSTVQDPAIADQLVVCRVIAERSQHEH